MRENRLYGSVGGWGLIAPRLPNQCDFGEIIHNNCRRADRGTSRANLGRCRRLPFSDQGPVVSSCHAHQDDADVGCQSEPSSSAI